MMKNELLATATATVNANEIPVTHTIFENKEFLKFSITGWDEVKRLTKKVLIFEGRRFTFSCWNSDDMYCIFSRPTTGAEPTVATIARK
jgi:hypothetical protein